METHSRDREGSRPWLPLLLSLVLVVGMILGFNLRDTLRSKRDINTAMERNDRLEQVIDLIGEKYVDSVNTDNLYKDAITGILKNLDPHTVYIPSEDLQSANEDLEGEFSGIGVEFSIVRDTIQVVSVIDNGPASHAGVELGDQLIKVGDSVVAGVNITSDRIVHLLKGKQKSNVSVTLKQALSSNIRQVSITRDIIPLHSVEANIMLDDNTGFIKVNRFSATTSKEFSEALKTLKSEGAKQLILDLRDNPGGYLEQAINLADQFLENKKLIVYTQGDHTPKTEYKASGKGDFETGKLAILIDEGSASASEILAGAIQDWDRGIIVGRRSFGKGLVQEPYEMEDGAELRLTIAKYYTPSGRCIQRSFANGKEAYRQDYEKRLEDGELTGNEDVKIADTTKYFTGNHRVVYGGGGIKPDVYVPYDTLRLSHTVLSRLYSPDLKAIIWDNFIANRQSLKYNNIGDFNRTYNGESIILSRYLSQMDIKDRLVLQKELEKPIANEFFRTHIKAQIARYLFHDNGYYSVSLKEDETVSKALDALYQGNYSKLISRK